VEEYGSIAKMIEYKNAWFELFNSLERCLPDNTWIVELDPSARPDQILREEQDQSQKAKTIFGKRQVTYQKPVDEKATSGTTWIKIKAHTLAMFQDLKKTEAEQFKENILASPMFTKNPQEIVILDYKTQENSSNNIDTFVILIKLNKTIPD
jgi:hypothetical protein